MRVHFSAAAVHFYLLNTFVFTDYDCYFILSRYTGQFNYLGDIARGSFECTTLTAACAALKALLDLQEQGKILMVRGKNRIDPQFPAEQGGGYRDGLINAILSDGPAGHVCELQIHMTDFLRVKHDGGHASYKVRRL